MAKNTRLINIYLKIHNKKTLTVDDLRYLAQYDPECFQKTCRNVVYNLPESKQVMEQPDSSCGTTSLALRAPDSASIQRILDNLKHLDAHEYPFSNLDSDKVKNLLGSLYMELLFPHNDKEAFIPAADIDQTSSFDARA